MLSSIIIEESALKEMTHIVPSSDRKKDLTIKKVCEMFFANTCILGHYAFRRKTCRRNEDRRMKDYRYRSFIRNYIDNLHFDDIPFGDLFFR